MHRISIEKHFILDKSVGGPDASFSLDPAEFKLMVSSVREAEKSLGKVDYTLDEKKLNNRLYAKSLFAVEDIKSGEQLTDKNVKSIRPGFGLHPKYLDDIKNMKAIKNIIKGTPISWGIIQ